ncbi:MAG: cadmium-translocating P-type ATPase [Phycisphaerae bacterium]|nr:cadmium-translocating P-type ATPase [Phycisphaerae bacterium]
MSKQAAYKVKGLDCADEIALLRNELGCKAGVLALDFDLLNAKMTVTYDPGKIPPKAILASINKTGLYAVPWELRKRQEAISLWRLYGRLTMAVISGVLLVCGFLADWIQRGSIVEALAAQNGAEGPSFDLLSTLCYIGAIISGAWFILPKAVRSARRLRPDMNLLMTVAVIGAMAINEWFEAAGVSFLFALALLLEHWSVGRARRAISALMEMAPAAARYVAENGAILEKPVEEVPTGVTVLIRPGEKIPLDGEVLKGASTVNQAPITGESLPISKAKGDEVFAGTINGDGALEIKVTKAAQDTTLARIIHMVESAQSRRSPSEQWIEKFARVYTPAMMALALAIAVIPPLFSSAAWSDWLYQGLVILVIACPCALVISTPVSIVSGLTAAARNGVLIKGGAYLEAAGRLRAVCLDKTGTLTYGRPEVQQVIPFNGHTREELLQIAAALESHSEHPLARAVLRKAEVENLAPSPAEGFQAIQGRGAQAQIEGRLFWIGSHRFMDEMGQETSDIHQRAESLEDAGHSVIAMGNDRHVCGLISVSDGVRENARDALQALKHTGVHRIVMLTGDNTACAAGVAEVTGVDEFQAELLPEDKVKAVEALVREYRYVAMVGEGVNDAPAMAASAIGVAMGAMGTDVAIETADIALMSDDLHKLPWLIKHSRRTLSTIKQNIAFALGLKLVFIVLALLNMATLWMAIAADMGASLLVIFNSLRLLEIKKL